MIRVPKVNVGTDEHPRWEPDLGSLPSDLRAAVSRARYVSDDDEYEVTFRSAADLRHDVDGFKRDLGFVPGWAPGEQVEVGDRRAYQGWVYACQQAHTTQSDWTPPETPALWGKVQATVPDLAERVVALDDVYGELDASGKLIVDTLLGRAID